MNVNNACTTSLLHDVVSNIPIYVCLNSAGKRLNRLHWSLVIYGVHIFGHLQPTFSLIFSFLIQYYFVILLIASSSSSYRASLFNSFYLFSLLHETNFPVLFIHRHLPFYHSYHSCNGSITNAFTMHRKRKWTNECEKK